MEEYCPICASGFDGTVNKECPDCKDQPKYVPEKPELVKPKVKVEGRGK